MTFLLEHWLACLCVLIGLGLCVLAQPWRHRLGFWDWRFYLPALILLCYGVGAFDFLPEWAGPTIALSAFGVFVLLLILVILTGSWHALLGYALTGLFAFGLGASTGVGFTSSLNLAGVFLASLQPAEPWWLVLLLFVPALVLTGYQQLLSLGSTRRWAVIGLRASLFVFLAFALAEMHARKPNENTTVLFVWDRSLSMPPETQERIFKFINDSVLLRGSSHMNDQVGVVVFGKQAKLELPPSKVADLKFRKVLSQFDHSYTDIAAAIKLALASFPEGSGKRIVLISDGNENMGSALEQARIARQNGVQIDVVPIAAGRHQHNEILVERIEAPPITEKDARLPIRVVVRSFHPDIVVARLNLRKMTFDDDMDNPKQNKKDDKADKKKLPVESITVKLHQGLNVYYFQPVGSKEEGVHAYEATVVPLHVETLEGIVRYKGLPGDRIDNNESRVCVIARGERAILLLEEKVGEHRLLADRLRIMKSSLKVVSMTPEQMRQAYKKLKQGDNQEKLALFLSKFDAIIFANIPADFVTEEEQKVIRSTVHDQGAGLIMIGGNQSFGAGGWQNTEIEKALPVAMELKAMKIEGKSGLVLMMHASEIADGNAWQRKIAKLAVEKLSKMDMIGMLHYDHGFNGGVPGHRWHINFQEIGPNHKKILGLIDKMDPGDMPDVDPAFEMARKQLMNPEHQLGMRHIIFISDGDHWNASPTLLRRIAKDKITCTTVCITSHGQDEVNKMKAVAQLTNGRSYHVKDPSELPQIYIKESRLVSKSFVYEKRFDPRLISQQGPTEGIPVKLPPLYGFVRTTPKTSSLVQELIKTPLIDKYEFPILATWQYGLGKSVAFTSDARTLAKQDHTFWDRDWANSDIYGKFWEQSVDWVLRPVETGKHLFMTTEHKDGKIRIFVEAQDLDKTPLTDLTLKAGISSPTFKIKNERRHELKFEQKNSGVYEAEIPADEVGAYFVNIQAWKKEIVEKDGKKVEVERFLDNIRAGVTIPYSPEFAEMESNPALLVRLAEATEGKIYPDDSAGLEEAARAAEMFRPVPQTNLSLQALWPWLVFLTAVCLLLDVAVRRIAIQPEAVWVKAVALWQRLRGQARAEEPMSAFIERLKSRKAEVDESIDKQKAGRKFEAAEGDGAKTTAPIVVPVAASDKPKTPPVQKAPAKQEAAEEDFATRLMRAKKKAMEDRDKDKLK